jgi:uncharacterized membrane protein
MLELEMRKKLREDLATVSGLLWAVLGLLAAAGISFFGGGTMNGTYMLGGASAIAAIFALVVVRGIRRYLQGPEEL